MKPITYNLERYTTPQKSYSDLVKETALLIKRSYPATLKMVEAWEPAELQALYDDCINKWRNEGFNSPAHRWWTYRGKKQGKVWTTN